MEVLNNTNEIIRSTTIWTLSKFTDWIAHNDKILEEYVTMLCQRMIDHDSNVQEATCTAFTVLVESAPYRVIPYIQKPLNTFQMVIEQYKGNSLIALFDAIGQMAESLKLNLRNEAIISQLLPMLIKKWLAIEVNDKTALFSMFECF